MPSLGSPSLDQPGAVVNLLPKTPPNNVPTTPPQSNDLQRTPGIKQPISDRPDHPVNSEGANVYFSRTNNLAGLSPEKQTEALANAMRSVGPGKVLLLETTGPKEGSYVAELRKSLPKALEMVPPSERPEIRFFISDGRPAIKDPAKPSSTHNEFGDYLQTLNREKPGSGMVYTDNSLGVPRAVPNWANDKVFDRFKTGIQETITLAKELGIRSVVVDDHVGIPPDNPNKGIYSMTAFKTANGLTTDKEVQNIVTGRYSQVLSMIKDAGLQPGLSTAADPAGSLRFGIDVTKLAPITNSIEMQGYRAEAAQVQKMASNLVDTIRNNFEQYQNVGEIKIALITRANGVDLSEQELVRQQKVITDLQQDLNKLFKQHSATPPHVTTSLWTHQGFYK